MTFISGYYCDEEGQTTVTAPCAPGFYCLTGSSVNSSIICPEGRYCPEGKNRIACGGLDFICWNFHFNKFVLFKLARKHYGPRSDCSIRLLPKEQPHLSPFCLLLRLLISFFFLASNDVCCLLITFANSLNPDQD